MGLLSMLGVNIPGLGGGSANGNPFSGLVGGGFPTPPTQVGSGFSSLIPSLVQAFEGKLGNAPQATEPPTAVKDTQALTPQKPNPDMQGGAKPADQSVQPPAMFVAPPKPQAVQKVQQPSSLPPPNIKPVSGSVDPKMLWDGLKARGLDDAQAAALLGNWKQESEFKPSAFNPGEGASGFTQWREARRSGLMNYARATGRNPTDPNVQMDYTIREAGIKPDETGTVRVDPGGPAFARARGDITKANAALKGYIRYGSPYNQGGEGTRLSNAIAYYNMFAGGGSTSPTFDAMSAPAGMSVAPGSPVTGVGPAGGFGGPNGFTAGPDTNTALASGTGPKKPKFGGATGGPPDPGASPGRTVHNELNLDYKRYAVRKNIDHLRALSPVAKITALENIGKGLSVNGGGSTS